jgi:ATP-binding cassette subfamily C protein EexD
MGRALQPISQIVSTWNNFTSARISYQKLNELLVEFPQEGEKTALPEPKGFIQFENVTIVPPLSQKAVLGGINIQIEPGEVIGVIGPSAAGKSSFAKAVVGVWQPAMGRIRIDGADIHQYNSDDLGEHIGYLPQDIELFEGSIAQNIARFHEDAKDAEIILAAKLSGTHELILNLPHGYDTVIGPGGLSLSGGQKQRIGLARAIYGNPKIIVLDEPNSNLDDAGEYALMMTISTLKDKGVTVVLVTHKKSILALADKLLVMKDGKVHYFDETQKVLTALSQTQENK